LLCCCWWWWCCAGGGGGGGGGGVVVVDVVIVVVAIATIVLVTTSINIRWSVFRGGVSFVEKLWLLFLEHILSRKAATTPPQNRLGRVGYNDAIADMW